MTKQLRSVILLGCVLVLIVGALVFLLVSPVLKGGSSSSTVASSTEIKLVSTDADNINKVTVKNSSGTFTIVRTDANKWSVEGLGEAPQAASNVSSVCSALASLSAVSKVAESVSDLDSYGLTSPKATITVNIQGVGDRTFLLGNETPSGSGSYCMEQGQGTIYVVSSLSSYETDTALSFVDTALVSVDSSTTGSITNYTFGGTKRPQPISINIPVSSSSEATSETSITYDWIESPHIMANTEKLSTLSSSVASISATGCVSVDVSAASLAKYGLDKPPYTFSFTLNGATTKILLGNTFTEDDTEYQYIMKDGIKAVYKISSSTVAYMQYTLADLASSLQFMVMLNDLQSMSVQTPDKTYDIQFTGSDDDMKVKVDGKEIKMDIFRDYYQNVIGTPLDSMGDKPANTKLLFKVVCNYKDTRRASEVMELYGSDSDNLHAYWNVNGTGGMIVLRDRVEKLISQTATLAAGGEIPSL